MKCASTRPSVRHLPVFPVPVPVPVPVPAPVPAPRSVPVPAPEPVMDDPRTVLGITADPKEDDWVLAE